MQMSLVAQNGKEYYLRSKTEQGAKQIMNALAIKEIPDFIPQRAINQYL
jgi:hypothetical protein